MGLLNSINEDKIVDELIQNKVNQLIEQSIVENKKRRKIEKIVRDKYCGDIKEDYNYFGAFFALSKFPKYSGRGIQEYVPDIKGSIINDGFTSMTLLYSGVSSEEVDEYKELLISNGFIENKNEFTKKNSDLSYYVMIEYSGSISKMRLYYTISKIK